MEIRKHSVLVIKSILTSLIIGALLVASSFVLVRSTPPSTLEQVLAAGELHVVSSNGPTTYYEGPNGLTGFEYNLVKGFADSLGVRLVISDETDLERMLGGVESQAYDFAAAAITPLEGRDKRVVFADAFMQVSQQLVYSSKQSRPVKLDELHGKAILISATSSHRQRVQKLLSDFPELQWKIVDAEMIDLLERVNKGEADYAVIDSSIYDLNRYSYPRAKVAFALNPAQDLAWAFPESADTSLFDAAQ